MANALTGIGPVAESLKQTNAGLLNLAGLLQMVQASKAETNRKAQEAANRQAQKDQDALLKVAATHGPVAASKFQADKQLNKEAGRPGILSEDTIASLTSEAAKNKGQTLTPIPEEFTPEWATKFGVKYVPDTNIVTDPKTGKVLTHEDGTPILTPKKSGEAGVRAALDVALAELRKTQSKLDAQEAETLAQNNFIREGKIILTKNALGQPDRVLSAVKLMFDVEVNGAFKDKDARAALMDAWLQGKSAWPFPTSWKERADAKGGGAVARARTLFGGPDYTVLDFGDQVEGASQYLGLLIPGSATANQPAPTSNDVIGTLPNGGEVKESVMKDDYKEHPSGYGTFEAYRDAVFQQLGITPVKKVPNISSEKE